MKYFIVAILSLSLWHNCEAQPYELNQGGTSQQGYFSPITYDDILGKIIVTAVIHQKTYRFILDTGAPNTISRSLYNLLQPPVVGKIPVADQSGAIDSLQVVSIDSILFGNVLFKNIPTLVADNRLLFDCIGVDGFIGSNMLRYSIVRFSSRERTITLTDDIKRFSLRKSKSSDLFLNKSGSNPYIWIRLKNRQKAKEQLLFDSGDAGFYSLSLGHYKVLQKWNIFNLKAQGVGNNTMGLHGFAKDTIQYRVGVPELFVCKQKFQNISIQTTSDFNSRLGSKLLEYGVVTLDYRNKKFYFEPFTKEVDLTERQFPISPSFRNDTLVVGIVWGEKYKELISVGSPIMKINGVDAQNIGPCDFFTMLSPFQTLDSMELTIKNRDGIATAVTIERE
jgi:hypothetical protein